MHWKKEKSSRPLMYTAIILGVFLLSAFLLCLTSIGQTAAKYISEGRSSTGASVARFSPSLTTPNNSIDISEINKPGDSIDYHLRIQNYSDDSMSEVAMKYKLTLNTTGNLPLTFTVLDVGGNVLVVWDCDGNSGDQQYEYESPLVFSPSVAQSHDYTIRVEWRGDRNRVQFSGMPDAVYVSVMWEQID